MFAIMFAVTFETKKRSLTQVVAIGWIVPEEVRNSDLLKEPLNGIN